MNHTNLVIRGLFCKEENLNTGKNSNVIGCYLWMHSYETKFRPHFFYHKVITNKKGFERDFSTIRQHHLFKERIDMKDEVMLVYHMNSSWIAKVRQVIRGEYDFPDLDENSGWLFHLQKQDEIGREASLNAYAREFNLKNAESVLTDKHPILPPFNFCNECFACTEEDFKLYKEWN